MQPYTPPKDLLAGRVILVTGAGDGIGRAAALTYAQHGATVVLLGRTTAKLEKVYDEIQLLGGPQAAIAPLDYTKASTVHYEKLAETLVQEFGRLDGLLHNAAELGSLTPLTLYDLDIWSKVMHVNLNAPFLLTRACFELLKKSTDASVIFTSADVGRKARAYWGAYAVSQFAVEGLMQIWADEAVGTTSIRMNSLNPGSVRTGMRTRAYPGETPEKLAKPEAIMGMYLYLMGPDSRGNTGKAWDAQ